MLEEQHWSKSAAPAHNTTQEQYKSMGDEVKKSAEEAMAEQMVLFRTKLEDFALKVPWATLRSAACYAMCLCQ
jgi:hypothetical protein